MRRKKDTGVSDRYTGRELTVEGWIHGVAIVWYYYRVTVYYIA